MKVKEIIRFTEWYPGQCYGLQKPVVSVLLPTFRRGASGLFIKAVRSVLNQSLSDMELIIIDDASVDGTADQIKEVMAQDGRVSCLRHPQNIGLPAISEYEAYLKAHADYIAFAFDDDEFYPNALKDLWEYARKNDSSIIHGHVDMHVYDVSTNQKVTIRAFGSGRTPQSALSGANFLSNNSVLLHRRVIEKVGFYDPHVAISRVCDWDLWRRISNHFQIIPVDVSVGQVFGPSTRDSLGHTYSMEPWQTMEWANLSRNQQLLPCNIDQYDVLALPENISRQTRIAIEEIRENFRNKFWFPKSSPKPLGEGKSASHGQPERDGRILVVASSHDASITLSFDHLPEFYRQRIRIVYPGQWLHEEMVGANAVIFGRYLFPFVEWIDLARKLQIPHYNFLDDNLMLLRHDPRYSSLLGSYSDEAVREILMSFSGVLLSTKALIKYFQEKQLHSNLFYFPPVAKRVSEYDEFNLRPKGDVVRMAFFGGSHRALPFKEVVFPAICEFARQYPVELFVCGMDEAFLKAPSYLPIFFFPFELSYDLALARLASCQIDLLVHPNSPTANNPYKTLNVLINAYIMDAVPVLSDEPPYDILRSENVALLCNHYKNSWLEALRWISVEPQRAQIIKNKLRVFCQERYNGEANASALKTILEAHPAPGLVLRDIRYRTLIQILRKGVLKKKEEHRVGDLGPSYCIAPSGQPDGRVRINHSVQYPIIHGHPNWEGLDVLVDAKGNLDGGQITLEIRTEQGQLLRRAKSNLQASYDSDWLSFRFAPISNSKEQRFYVKLVLTRRRPKCTVLIYESNPLEEKYWRLLRRAGIDLRGNQLYARVWYGKEI